MSNKKLGNDFEQEYAKILSEKGYWVAFFPPKKDGSQPCDLIAIKNNIPILIDCKTCSTHVFSLDRIETNQRQAFKKHQKCGNKKFILAVKYNNRIYEIDMRTIDFTQKSIDLERRTNENNCF